MSLDIQKRSSSPIFYTLLNYIFDQTKNYLNFEIASLTASPRADGEEATLKPAASIAFILSEAAPLPPATIAPACPILLPGGAVCPAIKPAFGFLFGWAE